MDHWKRENLEHSLLNMTFHLDTNYDLFLTRTKSMFQSLQCNRADYKLLTNNEELTPGILRFFQNQSVLTFCFSVKFSVVELPQDNSSTKLRSYNYARLFVRQIFNLY